LIGTHVGYWGRFRGKSRHCRIESKTLIVTYRAILLPTIDAVQKTYAPNLRLRLAAVALPVRRLMTEDIRAELP
jgi:hypothetical protein